MEPRLRPLVVALTIGVLLSYVGTFGAYAWDFVSHPKSVGSSTDPSSGGAIDYIWTSASVIVGSVVAVALGQPDPNNKQSRPSPTDLIVAYGWVWFAVGVAAIALWIFGTMKELNTPLIIRNAATTFIGLALPVVTAFLRDRNASFKNERAARLEGAQ